MRACPWCGGRRVSSPSGLGWGCVDCRASYVPSRLPAARVQAIPVWIDTKRDKEIDES